MLKKNNSCLIEQLTVIAVFRVVILFILCARKFVGKKKTLICYFDYFFAGLHSSKYFSCKNCYNNHKTGETSSEFSGRLLA